MWGSECFPQPSPSPLSDEDRKLARTLHYPHSHRVFIRSFWSFMSRCCRWWLSSSSSSSSSSLPPPPPPPSSYAMVIAGACMRDRIRVGKDDNDHDSSSLRSEQYGVRRNGRRERRGVSRGVGRCHPQTNGQTPENVK